MVLSEQEKNTISYIILSFFIFCFLLMTFHALHKGFKSEIIQKRFISGDSKHYYNGAKEIVSGNFRFAYIERYPHREILYPAALSIPLYFLGDDLVALGAVNIFFFCLAGLFAFLSIKRLHADSIAALFAAWLLLYNKFTFFNVTYELLTEGMFITCMIAAIYFFLSYLRTPRTGNLLWLGAICGIAQGIRPNGFFLLGALLAVLLFHQFFLMKNNKSVLPSNKTTGAAFVAAGLVFLVCSAPSWAPRMYYFGNPFYYSYLPNFLWADSYNQAHTPDVVFTFRDYIGAHTIGDLLQRMLLGIKKSFLDWPQHYISMSVWLALACGLATAAWKKNKSMLLLGASYFIVMAPVVWTVRTNPTPRIGFAYTLPFAAYFGAYALTCLRPHLVRRMERMTAALRFATNSPGNKSARVAATPLLLRVVPPEERFHQPFVQPPYTGMVPQTAVLQTQERQHRTL